MAAYHIFKTEEMKSKILSIIIFVFLLQQAGAQTLRGKVFDANSNLPLIGATITSGTVMTTSGKEGTFAVNCTGSTELVVTFIGYEQVRQPVKNCDQEIIIRLTRSDYHLNNIEITATSNVNKSILYQPASITKIEETEIKRATGLFLDDAINSNVPGVTMNRRAVSSGQQFNIRGYGNGSRGTRGISSNFDGQGYKVYLNGIPVTDAEGTTVLDDIDYGSIGNVEVTKGPAGSLYGLAIAGVVNLHTIKPEKGRTSIGQGVLIGNYGLQRYTTQFQKGGENSSILMNYGHQESDGFTIHNASHKDFVNFAGEFTPNSRQSINTYFGYSNSYDERSGELTIAQYGANDFSGNIEYIKRNAHSQVYTLRAGLSHIYNFTERFSNTTTIFGTGFNSNASSAGGWTDKASTNLGVRSTFTTKFALNNSVNLSGITGVESQRQNASTIGYSMIKDPTDPNPTWIYGNPYYWIIGGTTGSVSANGETSNVYTTTATTSAFTEWTLSLPHDVSITAGLGLSSMKVHLDDRFFNPATPNRTRRYDTSYNGMLSPRIAINKVFNNHFSAYASYNRGYKAPVSSYFFIPYVINQAQSGIVNKDLKPEKGDQFEIGTKGSLMNGRLTYQLAFFNAVFSDKMTTVAVPFNATTTLFSYVTNGGKQVDNGIEALVKYSIYQSSTGFFTSVSPFANITYSDFEYKDYPFHIIVGSKDSVVNYNGNKVAGVAKIVGNFGLDVNTKHGFYANMTWFYKDPMPITSDNLNITTSYSLLNAKLGFRRQLSKHFDLNTYFGVNNITDTKYPIMIFVNQLPDAYVAGPRYANVYGGINLKYIF